MSFNSRYEGAAKPGTNPFKLMLRYLHEAQRILRRRRMGKFRRTPRYLAKGGVRK